MMKINEIINATKGKLISGNHNLTVKGISTDSREDCSGKLFIPLIGENFNGHEYIFKAYENGASATLFHEDNCKLPENITCIKVNDTLAALGDIAKYQIEKNNIEVIGITGSAGKTTTKDLLKFVTGFKGTEKNYNNLVGVPLTILNLFENSKHLIVEIGTNIKGEIEKLTHITTPEYVIITNIGYGHIEGFGNIENVYKEKIGIVKNNNDLKKVFINIDNDILREKFFSNDDFKNVNFEIIKFGRNKDADIKLIETVSDINTGNRVTFSYNNKIYKLTSKLLGEYNALNILAVFGMAKELGIDDNDILENIEKFKPVEMRGDIIKTSRSFTVINDCYNANYESFKEAVKLFNDLNNSGEKYLVIGDMFELGNMSDILHEKLGKVISDSGIKYVLCFGDKIKNTIEKIDNKKHYVRFFNNKKKVVNFLRNNLKTNDTVLIKASRGMKFEDIVNELV